MDNDLISRSTLIEAIRERMLDEDEIMHELDREYNKGLLRAIKCVKRAPAVDAEPARRGEWTKPYKNDIWDCYVCSLCGYMCDSKFRFCPNCDAKMDRDAEK